MRWRSEILGIIFINIEEISSDEGLINEGSEGAAENAIGGDEEKIKNDVAEDTEEGVNNKPMFVVGGEKGIR